MDLRLTVLAGAKQGTSIPVKKPQFIIGRASECTLRAGSEAISRRHCMIEQTDDGWVASDLGSRNGTFVNEAQIAEPTLLNVGDELRVGPLKFRIELKTPTPAKPEEPKPSKVQPAGIKSSKQPPVKDVAEVAARTVQGASDDELEDDISDWLIGTDMGSKAYNETVNFELDETRAIDNTALTDEESPDESAEAAEDSESAEGDSESEESANGDASAEDDDEAKSKSGSWANFFGRGKNKDDSQAGKSQKPGKLPKIPDKDKAKDSREAAAEILREMTRRR